MKSYWAGPDGQKVRLSQQARYVYDKLLLGHKITVTKLEEGREYRLTNGHRVMEETFESLRSCGFIRPGDTGLFTADPQTWVMDHGLR